MIHLQEEQRDIRRLKRAQERENELNKLRELEKMRDIQRSILRSRDVRRSSPETAHHKITLHDRFTTERQAVFKPEDNISINIERNIQGAEAAQIPLQ